MAMYNDGLICPVIKINTYLILHRIRESSYSIPSRAITTINSNGADSVSTTYDMYNCYRISSNIFIPLTLYRVGTTTIQYLMLLGWLRGQGFDAYNPFARSHLTSFKYETVIAGNIQKDLTSVMCSNGSIQVKDSTH